MLAITSVSHADFPALQDQVVPSPAGSENLKQLPASPDAEDGAPLQINPVLQYDMKAKVLLFQIVDPASGEVEQQYPSEKQVEAYRKALEEQQDALPEIGAPQDTKRDTSRAQADRTEPSATSALAVSGGPNIDPGKATREISLVA